MHRRRSHLHKKSQGAQLGRARQAQKCHDQVAAAVVEGARVLQKNGGVHGLRVRLPQIRRSGSVRHRGLVHPR